MSGPRWKKGKDSKDFPSLAAASPMSSIVAELQSPLKRPNLVATLSSLDMMSPPAKRAARPVTTIGDLGDDLVREILVRLPALPSLVRAALACRAFLRAVRSSSSSFRRRFRALHPPSALGFFINTKYSSIPAFVSLRRRNDPDLAAAVRGGDFFLTRLPDHGQGDDYVHTDDDNNGWVIQGCRDGYILLINRNARQLAAYNPLTRTLDHFPPPPAPAPDQEDEISLYNEFHIFSDEEKPNSFRVFSIHKDDSVHVAVFSSDIKRWQDLPWPETPTQESWAEYIGAVGSKFMYWRHVSKPYMTVLNTVTLQFSRMDLPPALRRKRSGKGYSHTTTVMAGETKDGDPCIFEVHGGRLSIWLWTSVGDGDDDIGSSSWVMEEAFSFKEDDNVSCPWEESWLAHKSLSTPDVVTVAAAIHGFVYLHTNKHPCSFMSLCLETGELRKLSRSDKRSKYQRLHPYIMAWPPCLTNIKKMDEENLGKLAPQAQGIQIYSCISNH